MMRSDVFIFLLVCSCTFANAGTGYYPGMVHLKTDVYVSSGPEDDISKRVSNQIVFDFYKQPGDSEAVHTLSFYFDWAHIPRRERIWEDDYSSWLAPMSFDTVGGYDLYFVCKSRKDDWLEVIVNEQTKETLWIKNTFYVRFISWNKLNTRHRWVTVSPESTLYTQRDTASDTLQVKTRCFQIDKVKGNWMKINNSEHELCDTYGEPEVHAWILFRSPDDLFIDVTIY